MRRRLLLTAVLAITSVLMLGGASASQAAPGSLQILFVSNQGDGDFTEFLPVLRGTPGVATVNTFESSANTPSGAVMASHDLIVNTGDSSYGDQALYGDRLADYIDAGGAVIQFAYDNWEDSGAHPEGRFESGGYAPFIPGDNQNLATSLGTILVPGSPLLADVPSFTTNLNVTDALAPGATLLALWADARNAIATKGQVVSVTATPGYGGNINPISAAAQLALNAGNVLGPRTLTIRNDGRGTGTVTSTPARIDCGSACSARFGGSQATVTLNAKSTTGVFTGFRGGGCGLASTCTLTLGGDTTVTANFDACVVPRLKGKRLKKAKKRLRKNECRLGKVKNKGAGKVKTQKPKPGKVLPPNSKVKVTLG